MHSTQVRVNKLNLILRPSLHITSLQLEPPYPISGSEKSSLRAFEFYSSYTQKLNMSVKLRKDS
jgi:hypothetical protein